MTVNDIVRKIRKGELDPNDQVLFFSVVIKGLLRSLEDEISIRQIPVPHYILHTGDDTMFLQHKGENNAIEPGQISNEDYIYSQIPRCMVNLGNLDLLPDQLTNPYTYGDLQLDYDGSLWALAGEFRRMPIQLNVDLKYYVNSFRDMLDLIQRISTKMVFIKTFYITYMGQVIQCSYKVPYSFSDEHMMDLDGSTQDNKYQQLSLSLEIETNMPIWESRTIIASDNYIRKSGYNIDAYPKNGIKEESEYETVARNIKTRLGS